MTITEYIPGTAAYDVRRAVLRATEEAETGQIAYIAVCSDIARSMAAQTARRVVRERREHRRSREHATC